MDDEYDDDWALPPRDSYTPRDLVASRGKVASTSIPVSFGRVTRSGGATSMRADTRVNTPKGETRLWRARDKLAEKSGQKHTVYAVNGERYTGEWSGDVKHGQGVQIYVDGSKYDGMWKNGQRHGQGTFYKKVGNRLRLIYSGVWEHDQRSGTGTLNFKNGDRYEGEFKVGKIMGWGTMHYKNGDKYEGEFIDGKRHGFGVHHLANGNRYEGHWESDLKDGKGTFYYIVRNQRYDGEWVAGQPKCGAISEMNPEGEISIPPLELSDPARVLATEIKQIYEDRDAGHSWDIHGSSEPPRNSTRLKFEDDVAADEMDNQGGYEEYDGQYDDDEQQEIEMTEEEFMQLQMQHQQMQQQQEAGY